MTKKTDRDNVTQFRKIKKTPKPPKKSNHEPVFNLPPVTNYLVMIIVAVHLIRYMLPADIDGWVILNFGFIPARYSDAELFSFFPALLSPITHMFLHGGWVHLIMNTVMLMAFSSGLERFIGAKKTLILFIASGLIGALTHLAFHWNVAGIMAGASGGVSGLFGAVILMMQMTGRLPPGRKTLIPVIAIWVGISALTGIFGAPGTDMGIAWAPHIGGFFAGLFLFNPILKRNI